jgi:NADPH:quinone reductase-like Zn-dependent oxidoreductase
MSDNTMQGIRIHEYGGLETLALEQLARPQPQADQVLVRVAAAGVNPADWKMRAGYYKAFMPLSFPWTPGLDGAGTVEAVGADVKAFRKGQEVYGILSGGYAEYAVAAESDLQPKPRNLTFEQAASVPVGALTAWQMVIEDAKVQSGQQVLVHGAAGGVGLYAVQFARWKGAKVIGTASAGNLEFIRSLGVETAVDYNAAPFETVVHDVDVVVDTVGGDIPDRSWQVLRPGGVFVTVAARLTSEAGQAHSVRAVNSGRAKPDRLSQISELLESRQVRPVVGPVFPLAQARQAQELCQTGHGHGRIILTIADVRSQPRVSRASKGSKTSKGAKQGTSAVRR